MTSRLLAFLKLMASLGLAGAWLLHLDATRAVAVPPALGIGTTNPEARLEVHGDQAGNNANDPEAIVMLNSAADQGIDPKYTIYQGRDQYTTGASPTNNRWLGGVTATGDRSYVIEARILARCTGGPGCSQAPTYYAHKVGTMRSYNGGANCVWDGGQAGGAPGVDRGSLGGIFGFYPKLNPQSSGSCRFGILADFPANMTIQVNYLYRVSVLKTN